MALFVRMPAELFTEPELRRLLNRVTEKGARRHNPARLTRRKCAVPCAVIVRRVLAYFRRIRRSNGVF